MNYLGDQAFQDFPVLLLVAGTATQRFPSLVENSGHVIISGLQDLQSGLIQQIRRLTEKAAEPSHKGHQIGFLELSSHFLLKLDLLLFALIVFHDLESLLLDQPSLLDVELLLGLGVDLLRLLVGLLLDEGHHVLDLKTKPKNSAVFLTFCVEFGAGDITCFWTSASLRAILKAAVSLVCSTKGFSKTFCLFVHLGEILLFSCDIRQLTRLVM